jgi:hypothetical protein
VTDKPRCLVIKRFFTSASVEFFGPSSGILDDLRQGERLVRSSGFVAELGANVQKQALEDDALTVQFKTLAL